MADLQLFHDDGEGGHDEGDDSGLNIDDDYGESYNPDEGLSPLQKLDKYIDCDSLYSRQMVARNLVDTLRVVAETEDGTCSQVLQAMTRLAEDNEASVRTELMEQVPHIALYCQENPQLVEDPIPTYILPIIVKYLIDCDNQVRKTSQAALLVLMEQGLIHNTDIEEHVCPVIIAFSSGESSDDFRTEAVALMSKMAPLVGKEITERVFMPRFAEMCTDPLFQVRKVCAANFGEICSVVGQMNTEDHLLDKFFFLAEDGVWGVRKACAECFSQVSCACSSEYRHKELAEVFVALLYDASRWVRMAAFTALGGFISTFADPSNTGLYFDDEGTLTVGNPDDFIKEWNLKSEEKSHGEELASEGHNTKESRKDDAEKTTAASETQSVDVVSENKNGQVTPEAVKYKEEDMDIDEQTSQDNKSKTETKTCETSPEEQRAKQYSKCNPESISSSSQKQESDQSETQTSSDKVVQDVDDTDSSVGSAQSRKSELSLKLSSKVTSSTGDSTPESFSSFLFWREPLPDINVESDLTPESETHTSNWDAAVCDTFARTMVLNEEESEEFSTDIITGGGEQIAANFNDLEIEDLEDNQETFNTTPSAESPNDDRLKTDMKIHTANVSTVSEATEEIINIGSMHVLGHHANQHTMTVVNGVVQDIPVSNFNYCPIEDVSANSSQEPSSQEAPLLQDVIPQALLDHYLSMTNPARAQTVDAEIARHCAFSLPAVAYTLGRKNWSCLRELYEQLAGDMQWKVRRTLAFSIHELALIVGSDVACRDLVSVFDGFLRDLDEVRIGALKHLGDFLKLLTPDIRINYLPRIKEFQNTDNQRNWRFREDLALQLTLLLDLYTPEDIFNHLVPVVLDLCEDSVAAVRCEAFRVVAGMLKRFSNGDDKQIPIAFVNDIIGKFAHNNQWNRRQFYVQMCSNILNEKALGDDKFATDMMPSLLALGKDPIPNVRISLALLLAKHMCHSDYFTSSQNPHHDDLLVTIQQLKCDSDKDVKYFISYYPITDVGDLDMIPV